MATFTINQPGAEPGRLVTSVSTSLAGIAYPAAKPGPAVPVVPTTGQIWPRGNQP